MTEDRFSGETTVVSGKIYTTFLLLGSFVGFFNFAGLYFRERLFPHHGFAFSKTKGLSPRSNSGGGRLSLQGACRAFSGTFALSWCIFELIILEVAGVLKPETSALAWRLCLILMVVSLHVVLPFLLAFAWLGEIGFGSRSSCVGALVLLSMGLFSASTLGSHGYGGGTMEATDIGTGQQQEAFGENNEASESFPSFFSLEAGLARVGAIGVASLALLSGFGAVNLPYQQLATLLRRVPTRLVESRERRARLTLADIGERKRRAAIARAAAASSTPERYRGGTVRGRRGDHYDRRWGFLGGLVEAITPASTGFPWKQAAEEAETANLEKIVRELFLEVADCRRIQEQQRRARTCTGSILVFVGGVMFVYCILRLWKAGVAVLWTPYAYPSGVDSAASDPTTQVVRFALRQHLLVKEDAEGWSELISFLLIGVLVLLQTRGFLVTITRLSRSSMVLEFSISPEIMTVLISMLMGAYFTSSVILMRVNLPPRHRPSITAVLGGMTFGFYQRWFDTVFLLSGCASAVILFFLHLANRSSDADHHHTVAVDGAVSHFRSSLEMESSNQEFSSGPGVSSTGAQGAAVRIRPKGRVSVAGGMKPLCGTGDDLSSTVRSSSSYDRTWVTSRHKPPSKQS